MIVYRIAKSNRIGELKGAGAEKFGGRWNPPGYPVIYTASNSSLAILEHLVHLDMDLLTRDFMLAEIRIEGKFSKTVLSAAKLPAEWNAYPAPDLVRETGRQWLESMRSLILVVPSAVNPLQNNILINPRHAEISKVSVMNLYPIALDERMMRKK